MQTGLDLIGKGPAANFIKDTDETHFEQDVLAASMKAPVIVDFWAPWCAPCKQLMPLLEKAVKAAGGAVTMVKVNIDRSPELAQALRIQSVPTVYAFFQGKPVDGFAGQKPESEVNAFVSRLKLMANPASAAEENAAQVKKLLADADLFFQQGKTEEAMNLYSGILEADAENTDALGGICWSLLAQGEVSAAREMLDNLPPDMLKKGRLQGLNFIFSLKERVSVPDTAAALEQKVQKNPQELQNYFDLALQYFSAGALEKGIETLMTLIRKNREWQDKKARTLLLEIFEALGNAHPLTLAGRRKLSAVLFS